jgi:autotransporter-associated beta strand protein
VGDAATLRSDLPGTGVLTIGSVVANNAAAKTLTLRGTGNTVVAGAISQTGAGVYSLLKLDGGTATLNAANGFTGNVNIGNTTTNGGTLKLGAAGAIPNNILTVLSGTLDMNGIALNPSSVVLGGGPAATSANINTNGATLTLGGNVTYNTGSGTFLGSFINGPVSLGGVTRTFTTGDTGAADPDLTINGPISDATGGLFKAGGGQLALTGTTANTWAGPTTISNGSIQLGKTPGVNAVPGDVSITPSGGSFHSVLKWLASHQVPDTAIITMTGTSGVGGGNMDLNGFDETIAGLAWTNNQATGSQVIRTGGGTLTINSDITIAGSSAATTTSVPFGAAYVGNLIDGNLNLGGAVRTIDITATGNAVFSAAISNGGILKTGGSRLQLSGPTANTFTGDTTVSAGTLFLAKPAGVTAIGGNVLVNGGNVFYQDQRNDQIADTASVTLEFGTFSFAPGTTGNGNSSETLANITINGGTFRTTVGTITTASFVTLTGTLTIAGGDFAVNSGSSLTANKIIVNGGINVVGGNTALQVNRLTAGAGGMEFTGGQMKMNIGTVAGAQGSQVVLGGNVKSFASFSEAGFYGESAAGTIGTRTIEIGAGQRIFDIEDGGALADFRIDFDITGSGTLVKQGAGTLALNGLIGTGTTSLVADAGVVEIAQSQTLAALVIGAGGTVILNQSGFPAPAESGAGEALAPAGFVDDYGAPRAAFTPSETEAQSSVAAVPEPGALGLLAFGALGFFRRSRPRREGVHAALK